MQGVGKVVSYTNADRILPRELLDAIQQYADGVYLYIPRKAERKRAWGEATDSRRERLARNRELYEKHLGGAPVHKLAEEYYLSAKRYNIVSYVLYGFGQFVCANVRLCLIHDFFGCAVTDKFFKYRF